LYFQKSRRQIVITENETVLHNLYKGFKEDFPHVFNEKHPTIRANSGGGTIPSVFTRYLFREKNYILMNRLLTVGECEALQTLPRGYTDGTGVSKSQRYKMLGNGFTVKVIEHLLKSIPI
jgi:site-specific DNA-cytosine methylase